MKRRGTASDQGGTADREKPERTRQPGEPLDENLEWDRDGQYFHYLTKWMHALNRVSRVTGDPSYLRWAMELAQAAHARFVYLPPAGGRKRMYWKMSIDLTRPLVPSMGQHDPLDGLVTYMRAAGGEPAFPAELPFPTSPPGSKIWPPCAGERAGSRMIRSASAVSCSTPGGWRRLMGKGDFGEANAGGGCPRFGAARAAVVRSKTTP